MSSAQLQSSTHPPAQPSYILRGHTAQIHAVRFFRQNLRLLTGDADGWVVLWDVPIKRPMAVWKPHGGTVLGIGSWGQERIVTHGRDGRLHIWQLREGDEASMSKTLPIDDPTTERKAPWLLHTLVVSAINFCSFASILSETDDDTSDLLVATPGVQDGSINLTSFPSETRIATIPAPRGTNTGMLMAVALHHSNSTSSSKDTLIVVAGYESGHTALFHHNPSGTWESLYTHKPHAQPVLSVAVLPPTPPQETGAFLSSSADALIVRHPFPSPTNPRPDSQVLQTRHAGQQSLAIRSDNLVFATAGWDGRVRVYSAKGSRELAVLKWHKEGCYAVAFAEVVEQGGGGGEVTTVVAKRVEKAKTTHWVAAGSKDGKVSLWEVY